MDEADYLRWSQAGNVLWGLGSTLSEEIARRCQARYGTAEWLAAANDELDSIAERRGRNRYAARSPHDPTFLTQLILDVPELIGDTFRIRRLAGDIRDVRNVWGHFNPLTPDTVTYLLRNCTDLCEELGLELELPPPAPLESVTDRAAAQDGLDEARAAVLAMADTWTDRLLRTGDALLDALDNAPATHATDVVTGEGFLDRDDLGIVRGANNKLGVDLHRYLRSTAFLGTALPPSPREIHFFRHRAATVLACSTGPESWTRVCSAVHLYVFCLIRELHQTRAADPTWMTQLAEMAGGQGQRTFLPSISHPSTADNNLLPALGLHLQVLIAQTHGPEVAAAVSNQLGNPTAVIAEAFESDPLGSAERLSFWTWKLHQYLAAFPAAAIGQKKPDLWFVAAVEGALNSTFAMLEGPDPATGASPWQSRWALSAAASGEEARSVANLATRLGLDGGAVLQLLDGRPVERIQWDQVLAALSSTEDEARTHAGDQLDRGGLAVRYRLALAAIERSDTTAASIPLVALPDEMSDALKALIRDDQEEQDFGGAHPSSDRTARHIARAVAELPGRQLLGWLATLPRAASLRPQDVYERRVPLSPSGATQPSGAGSAGSG